MLREEWEFWTSTQIEALPEFMGAPARLHLPVLADAMFPVHPETELAPGLVIHAAGGHTPGHAVLEIHDGGQTLLWCSDTILHPLHFSHPDCHSAFDIDPAQAIRTVARSSSTSSPSRPFSRASASTGRGA
jgi:glyoxylase-like metal-dependent hydrolase (beta-lactamase superfamily II)